jgi:hypothetical protein
VVLNRLIITFPLQQDDGDDGDEMGGMPAGFAELFNNPEVVALLKVCVIFDYIQSIICRIPKQ